jgi:Uma2 family endonuclease
MPIQTLITAKEFAKTGPETDGFELVRGELVPMPPPKRKHGVACVNTVSLLKNYTKEIGRGTVMCNDTGLLTQTAPDTVRGVDVMLYLNPSWAGKEAPDEHTSEPPDLAVEVRSPDQSWTKVLEKVTEYLNLGVRLVWVIDPKTQRVHVFQPDQEPQVFAGENELEGGAVLPGFRCRVSEIFA